MLRDGIGPGGWRSAVPGPQVGSADDRPPRSIRSRRAAARVARSPRTPPGPRPWTGATPPAGAPPARTSPTWSTPDSFVEYGRFAIAAQRARRDLDDLIARTPADGLIAGTARHQRPTRARCCPTTTPCWPAPRACSGTARRTGSSNSSSGCGCRRCSSPKAAAGARATPTTHGVSSLEVRAFKLWAALSGVVPRIAVVKGRCFAGNAVIAGCSDLIVATEDASIGMGGPAMIAGGGLGDVDPDDGRARSRCRRPTVSSTSSSPTRPRRSPSPSACSATSRDPTAPGAERRPNSFAHNHSRARPARLPDRPGHRRRWPTRAR